MQLDVEWFLVNMWGFLLVGVLLSAIGLGIKDLMVDPTKSPVHKIYWKTLPVHPVLAGMLIGLVPSMQMPDFMGGNSASVVSRVIWYGTAGVFSTWSYSTVKGILGKAKKKAVAD